MSSVEKTSLLKKIEIFLKRPVDNRKGIALILSVSALSLLVYFAMEVMYDSNVEYVVNSQSLNRLKAYYAAQAGIDVSLLRIKIYSQVKSKLGKQADGLPFLEEIWKFPLIWPMAPPSSMSAIEKDDMAEKVQESFLDAQFTTQIDDEGSKIDLNDLVSSSETLRTTAKNMLQQIFESKIKSDDEFRNKYANYRFTDLIGFITDWMSNKRASAVNGDKTSYYRDFPNQVLPPNRAFRTLKEVKMVAGMTDELFALLEPRITIYGLKGINPNNASVDMLTSLDPGITLEIAQKIQERVRDPLLGPFKSGEAGVKEFWDFVVNKSGARLLGDPDKVPIVTDQMVSFRISALGNFANAKREINVITFDLAGSAQRVADAITKEAKAANPQGTQQTQQPQFDPVTGRPIQQNPNPNPNQSPAGQKANDPLPKGPPRIVYWNEQ